MDHIFVDVKTKGTSLTNAVVTEVAMIRSTIEGRPIRAHRAEIGAGKTFADVRQAFDATVIAPTMAGIEQPGKVLVVTWNADVRHYLRKACEGGELWPRRAWIDLMQVAWPLQATGLIKDRTLLALTRFYGVPFEAGSDAASQAMNLMRVYFPMMQRFRTALHGESAIAELGGDTLREIRNMMGF